MQVVWLTVLFWILATIAFILAGIVSAVLYTMWREYRRRQLEPLYHADGVPVGLYPGDAIPSRNHEAIWHYLHQNAGDATRIVEGQMTPPPWS